MVKFQPSPSLDAKKKQEVCGSNFQSHLLGKRPTGLDERQSDVYRFEEKERQK